MCYAGDVNASSTTSTVTISSVQLGKTTKDMYLLDSYTQLACIMA